MVFEVSVCVCFMGEGGEMDRCNQQHPKGL